MTAQKRLLVFAMARDREAHLTAAIDRRLLEHSGFVVQEVFGIPPPYPLAIGHNAANRLLLRLSRVLIGLSVGLFSYQYWCW